jgi:8-oxo-dGTP pyrophosphatase MutT (NUDIX family)
MSGYTKGIREIIGSRPFILVGSTIVVINHKKEILLQHRSDTKEWGLPGGAMELGESLEQTAERELFEETGLTTKKLSLLIFCQEETFISNILMAMKSITLYVFF